MNRQSKMTWPAAACLLLALSACGGHSSNDSTPPTSTVPPPPVSMIDSFTSFVMNLIGAAPDDTQAQSIDAVSVTVPEDIEPVVVN
jgi:hypothetical protein